MERNCIQPVQSKAFTVQFSTGEYDVSPSARKRASFEHFKHSRPRRYREALLGCHPFRGNEERRSEGTREKEKTNQRAVTHRRSGGAVGSQLMNSPISTQRTIRRYPGVGWRDEGKREKERKREMSREEVPEDFSVTSCLILG